MNLDIKKNISNVKATPSITENIPLSNFTSWFSTAFFCFWHRSLLPSFLIFLPYHRTSYWPGFQKCYDHFRANQSSTVVPLWSMKNKSIHIFENRSKHSITRFIMIWRSSTLLLFGVNGTSISKNCTSQNGFWIMTIRLGLFRRMWSVKTSQTKCM